MSQGLQTFNADGTVGIDTNTLLGRVLGSLNIAAGQASGTISNAQFSQGTPFLIGMLNLGAFTGSILTGPAFSQLSYTSSGTTVTWTRSTNQYEGTLPAGVLYYGVY